MTETAAPSAASASLDDVTTQIGRELGPTFTSTPWYGWLSLLGALLLGVVAARLLRLVFDKLAERLRSKHRDGLALILHAAARPAGLALFTSLLGAGLQALALTSTLETFFTRVVALLYVVAIAWFLIGLVALAERGLRRVIARDDERMQAQIIPLIGRALRIFLLVVFVLFTAENIFNADISAWLAGLGIAGLAVSLAAQDSVKNLFGSLTVLMDRPFVVGDAIIFDGDDGVVESIGLRATKIRTPSGHLITVPNMKFTDSKVENITARGFIRRSVDLAIARDTPPERIEEAVAIVRRLMSESDIAGELDALANPPRVSFDSFAVDSVNIRLLYWYRFVTAPSRASEESGRDIEATAGGSADYWAFIAHAERVNLRVLRAFADAGIEFAFPTRRILLAPDSERDEVSRSGTAQA